MSLSFRRRLPLKALTPGRYLTDGRGLFRVTSLFDDSRSVLVVIEDCLTLESRSLAAVELKLMGFRRVRNPRTAPPRGPAPAPASSPAPNVRFDGVL
jgi:hypothetical protein